MRGTGSEAMTARANWRGQTVSTDYHCAHSTHTHRCTIEGYGDQCPQQAQASLVHHASPQQRRVRDAKEEDEGEERWEAAAEGDKPALCGEDKMGQMRRMQNGGDHQPSHT